MNFRILNLLISFWWVAMKKGEHGGRKKNEHAPDAIRQQFYQLFYWHPDVTIADVGNVKQGATLTDTYAALKTVVRELN